MKLTIIGYKNVKIDAFTQPVYVDVDPANYALQIARALKTTEDVKLLKDYSSLVMYHLGTFDDETGKVENPVDGVTEICNIMQVARGRLIEIDGKNKS